MKSCLLPPLLALAVLLGGPTHLGAAPAGTAISYQGQLNDNGVPANGSYEFRFILHDSAAAGVPIGTPRTNAPVAVVGGGFTTSIDFGPGAFNGDARFLEIAVRPAGSAAAFTPLTPRQGLSPMPYALRALEGSAGPQGPAGATGPQGSKGDKGDKGDPGTAGAPGSAGVQGPKGDKGDPGNAGIPGATGPQGLQGVPGPQGLVGPAGATGPAGPKGDKGDTGAQGPAGAGANLTPGIGLSIVGSVISLGTNGAALNSALVFKGNSVVWDTVAGAPGPKGDKGDPGAAGPQGPKGDKGDAGTAGAAGPKGDTGLTGAAGVAGPAGPKGDKGEAGAAGAQGPQGLKGDIGLTGATGPAGPTGATGATGPQGIQGVPGPTGATGPQGAPGPIGLTGVTGPKGDLGATGPAGPAGARGVNWRGEWAAGTAYAPGDAVASGGASWFAKAASTGVTPVAGASWDLLADKGAAGPAGTAPENVAQLDVANQFTEGQTIRTASGGLVISSSTGGQFGSGTLRVQGNTGMGRILIRTTGSTSPERCSPTASPATAAVCPR